ncbi:NAD-dependent epimerase/dehydratase family protein [Microbacterium protaetiae]|uniref:NAD-dependent epimerase/dehydratase family protein n=1 Tax=Microbacterium protaetiae TaxID=2509458 RepID=A0A4P6EAR5_9MICO|nr:NAD(P)H-binding protein [Microbacterium protaetiae]QAY58586.1 NAD-dependent epimerase/dehydratase family protein [Microbacterium protaetiae]
MNTPILVTGGTGTIGSRVVPLLRDAGRDVRILSRHRGDDQPGIQHVEGDTVAGRGLAEALHGVDIVLHLAGGAKGDDIAAKNLATAAKDAGVRHLILISVVGADTMPIGYFRAKAMAERAFMESGVPWTVLRAAQLHSFVLPIIRGLVKLPFLLTPGGLRFEPVHVDDVAARLTQIALGAPAGRVTDIVGPDILDIRQLADAYIEVMGGRTRRSVPVRIPGSVGRAYRAGDNLAGAGAQKGQRGWSQFLSELRTLTSDGATTPGAYPIG